MKKVIGIFIILLSLIIIPGKVSAASNAKTLRELRAELASWKQKQSENLNKQKSTKNQISNAESSVSNKQNEIKRNQQTIADSIKESEQLTQDIEKGKKELSELMKTYQVANGDNVYLEYIFKANSYEDLIYRYAVMEQIMDYQDKKIEEYKNKIEENTKLKSDLEAREVTLNQQISDLSNQIQELDDLLDDYFDLSLDIKDEIKSTQELIDYYKDIGCGEDEDLNTCVSLKGDTGFLKPLSYGVTTSLFGYRTHPVTGKTNTFHTGIDIGGNKEGTPVYSVANGTVTKIIKKSSCGGNQVYIVHNIKGKKYTTAYLHLLVINVTLGQQVNSNTVVGTVGGGRGTASWDGCSTGAHLHFGVGTGWYGISYASYATWKANLLDPKEVFNFPGKGGYFYSRKV